jgi:hypothetical protein
MNAMNNAPGAKLPTVPKRDVPDAQQPRPLPVVRRSRVSSVSTLGMVELADQIVDHPVNLDAMHDAVAVLLVRYHRSRVTPPTP